MSTRIPLPYQSPAVAAGRADDHRPALRHRRFGTFLPALLVAGLAIGFSADALADPPPPPSENHVWGGCELTTGAVTGLEESLSKEVEEMETGVPAPHEIDFVLVYSRQNDNDGQHFGEGTTGPILCTNPNKVDIETTEENTPIPGGTDTVDITALEQALILQYEKTVGETTVREKRVCHTVANHTDCFLITPVGD